MIICFLGILKEEKLEDTFSYIHSFISHDNKELHIIFQKKNWPRIVEYTKKNSFQVYPRHYREAQEEKSSELY